jgi:hypothetical protein
MTNADLIARTPSPDSVVTALRAACGHSGPPDGWTGTYTEWLEEERSQIRMNAARALTALSPDREPVGKKMTDEEFQNFWGKGINPPGGNDAVGRLRAVLTEIASLPPALLPSQLVDRFIEVRMKAKAALDETSADCCGSQGNVTAPVGKDEVEGLIEKLDKRATLEEWACDGDRELDVLLRKATTTIRALHSRNKAMKEALEPFGKEAEKFEGVPDNVYAYKNTPYTVRQYGDEQALKYCRITIEDLRRARALSTGER